MNGATSSVTFGDSFPSRGSLEGGRQIAAPTEFTGAASPVGDGRTTGDGAFLVPEDAARQLSMQVNQLGRIVGILARKMEDLEKENARRVTVSHAQALALQRQIRGRAEAVCREYGLQGAGDAAAFRKAIKKDVLDRFGIRDLHDLPLSQLDTAAERVARYMSIALVMERRRGEHRAGG